MKMKQLVTLVLFLSLCSMPVFADYTISQRRTMEGVAFEMTIQAKGVRMRRTSKVAIEEEDDDPMARQMMESMMPSLTYVSQCDMKQDLEINDRTKSYFIEYYDWSSVKPEILERRPKQKVIVKGTVTMSSVVSDSGKRQQMFGLSARWLKHTMEYEFSADSCDGASKTKIESEGWYVNLALESDSCPLQPPPPDDGGCRPRLVYKTMQNAGFLLEGTTSTYVNGKKEMVEKLETTALSKATLDQALFEIPKDYTEVDSRTELMQGRRGPVDTSARSVYADGTKATTKTVAVDFFSGRATKLDQNALRAYVAERINDSGASGYLINSQTEIASGRFANVVGVEIKNIKESGASRVGGLFGRVTGTPDLSKAGSSTAEVVITVYGADGKTVLIRSPASAEVKGDAEAAVRAAIDKAIGSALEKIK